MLNGIENLFFYFIFYSVLGWVYETVLCSLEAGHGVNRGFLNGPYCPIYGLGATAFLLLLGREQSIVLIFLFGAIIACTVEYLTSYAMEKAFRARWWDYSNQPFNLNGRICLGAGATFGLFAVLLIKVIHPAVSSVFSGIDKTVFLFLDGAAAVVFLLDLVITLKGFAGFHKRKESTPLTRQQERLIKAFPTLKMK